MSWTPSTLDKPLLTAEQIAVLIRDIAIQVSDEELDTDARLHATDARLHAFVSCLFGRFKVEADPNARMIVEAAEILLPYLLDDLSF